MGRIISDNKTRPYIMCGLLSGAGDEARGFGTCSPSCGSIAVETSDAQQSTGLVRNLSRMVSPVAPHQSLPCVRGGGPPNGGSEGLPIPQSASLTAPFTQGSLFSVIVRKHNTTGDAGGE